MKGLGKSKNSLQADVALTRLNILKLPKRKAKLRHIKLSPTFLVPEFLDIPTHTFLKLF